MLDVLCQAVGTHLELQFDEDVEQLPRDSRPPKEDRNSRWIKRGQSQLRGGNTRCGRLTRQLRIFVAPLRTRRAIFDRSCIELLTLRDSGRHRRFRVLVGPVDRL